MTTPAKLDITIYEGDSFDLFFRLKARDITGTLVYKNLVGATVKSQYRQTSASLVVLAEFTCTLADQVTTPGGVLLHLDPVVTAALVVVAGVWDCEVVFSATDKRTLLAGKVKVTKGVTR